MEQKDIKEKRQFEQSLGQIISSGYVTMAIAIGRQSGLFKVLCDLRRPALVKDIAAAAQLKERYVKEWLGCMVAAKLVEIDRHTDKYFIPESHKQALMSPLTNLASGMLVYGKRHEQTMACFLEKGPKGFDYDAEPSWFEWQDQFKEEVVDRILDGEILPNMSEFGFVERLKHGINVIDIGCGTGNFSLALAKRFPKSRFLGVDNSEIAVKTAVTHAEERRQKNVEFEICDAMDLKASWTRSFDLVFMYDVLHDLPDTKKVVSGVYRLLKEDGLFLLAEEAVHSKHAENVGSSYAALDYSASLYLCLPSSLAHAPHGGYGACWGMEDCEKTLTACKFTVRTKQLIDNSMRALYLCWR